MDDETHGSRTRRWQSATARRLAFFGLAAVQLTSFVAFVYCQRRADLAMDKGGTGDLAQFEYWNDVADTPMRILIGAWVLTIFVVPWGSADRTKYVVWLLAGLPGIVVLGFLGSLAYL